MCDMNSDFLNEVCEYVYGDEFTKYDVKNLLRNLKPAYEGTGILKFGTINNSTYFMEFVIGLWEQLQQLRDKRRRYRNDLKTEKDYDLVCNQLNQEREHCKIKISEMREKYESLEKENVNNNPLYKKLEHDYKKLYYKYKELDNKLEDQQKLKEDLIASQLQKSEIELKFKEFYQDKYKKDKKQLDKEIDKYKQEYVRQDDKICNMEKNQKIKKLEKLVKNLQEQLIESMNQ